MTNTIPASRGAAIRRALTLGTALGAGLLVSACGGGDVATPSSAPPAAAPTTPTTGGGAGGGGTTAPTTPSTPTRSAEYQASGAVVGMDAGYAYDRNITGMGVVVADVDTGIDQDNAEFKGRVSADSRSFDTSVARCRTCAPETVSFSLQDRAGHGTATASVIAAAADGSGVQGVAPGATILALKIAAPDMTNVTETSGPIPEGSGANTMNLAPAIAYAVDKGAFAISMSLNGTSSGQAALDQRAAMDRVAAADRLVVESVSNEVGSDGSAAGQIAANLVGADGVNRDWFLFGIRVDANGSAPSGNGVPGALADRTLAVVATNVAVAKVGGGTETVTGNSFAAPAIAGAAALLKQYWPQLGGKAIARILLDTARDLGAAGVDQVYGAGLLDVSKAMQAQGPTLGTSAATAQPLAGSALTFGSAFGGAEGAATWSKAAGTAIVLDRYGRDYGFAVGGLAWARAAGGVSVYGATIPTQAVRMAPAMNQSGALAFGPSDATSVHPESSAPRNAAFAFRAGPRTLVSGSMGAGVEDGGLATGSMLRATGIATRGTSLAVLTRGYRMSFGMASSSQTVGGGTASAMRRMLVQAPSGLRLGVTAARERGSALGLAGTGAFAIRGAVSTFATFGWAGDVGGFQLLADAMVGRTRVRSGSDMIGFAAPILSTGFRVQADYAAFGGVATLGLTSPMRVQSARLRTTTAYAYDLASLSLLVRTTSLDLGPDAREMDLEAGWSRAVSSSASLAMGAALATDAGNVAGRTSAGVWLRFSKTL